MASSQISFVGQAAAAATTVTIPTQQVGDLMIIFAYRNAATAPTLPAGWTQIDTQSQASTQSFTCAYRIATTASETSGTWTNATVLQCCVYRNASGVGNFTTANDSASGATATISTVALSRQDGQPWGLCFVGSKQTTSQGTPLALYTQSRGTQSGTSCFTIAADTNRSSGLLTSFSATTSANGTNAPDYTIAIEILPAQPTFLEPGGDADFGVGLWTTYGGTPAVATDFVHGTHVKSIKYRPANADALTKAGTCIGVGRYSIWIYINALPASAGRIMAIKATADGQAVVKVVLFSDGTIQLQNNSSAQLGSTSATTYATGQWYQLTLAWNITSTTVNSIKLFNGASADISVTNGTLINASPTDIYVGNIDSDASLDLRSSDHYADNDSGVTYPGAVWVTAKRPNANGSSNNFTKTGTGSSYGTGNAVAVNERPVNTASFVSTTPTSTQTEDYFIENTATGDIAIPVNANILGITGWVYGKLASTSNSPVTNIILFGRSFPIVMTTSDAFYAKALGNTLYPLNGVGFGFNAAYTTTGHLVTLEDCGVIVAYAGGTTGKLKTIGQAINRAGTY